MSDTEIVLSGTDALLLRTRVQVLEQAGFSCRGVPPAGLTAELLRSTHCHVLLLCHTIRNTDLASICRLAHGANSRLRVTSLVRQDAPPELAGCIDNMVPSEPLALIAFMHEQQHAWRQSASSSCVVSEMEDSDSAV